MIVMRSALAAITIVAGLGLGAACSSSPDTALGAELFNREMLGDLEGCTSCHTVTERPSVGGPSLMAIGSAAGERIDGADAKDYLRESIVDPTAHYAPGWGEGMPSYAAVLTDDELEALVAYLRSRR
jgi:mono/diheme cytochrome c family protein